MSGAKEAFVGLLPIPHSSSRPILPFHRARTERRVRYVYTPCARSLDSYREGMRFRREPPPQDSGTNRRGEAKQRKHVPLVKAMVHLNVASHETCEFMVRKGFVRVNGLVITAEKARVNRYTDRISVNGKDFGTMEQKGYDSDIDAQAEEDKGFLPRTQRDFSTDALEGERGHKKFSRRVDGGFFANKKYHFGK